MEKFEENISVGVTMILSEIVNMLLYVTTKNEDGTFSQTERVLPFRLRYRLARNKVVLDKIAQDFYQQRLVVLAQYGELSEDQKTVVIKDEEKKKAFEATLQAILESPVACNLIKVEEEDIDAIRETNINLSADALSLFIGYLTNDTQLIETLNKKTVFNYELDKKDVAAKPKKASTKKSTKKAAVDTSTEEVKEN